jgi:hypothetical protein
MLGVEDVSDQKKEPFFPQPAGIDAFFAPKLDAQAFLDLLAASTHNLTNTFQAIFQETISTYSQNQILIHRLAGHDTIKECFSRLDFHLTSSIMFHYLDFGPDTQEERILAEGEFASSGFPSFEVGDEVGIVKKGIVEITGGKNLPVTVCSFSGSQASTMAPFQCSQRSRFSPSHQPTVICRKEQCHDPGRRFDLPVVVVDDCLRLAVSLLRQLARDTEGSMQSG